MSKSEIWKKAIIKTEEQSYNFRLDYLTFFSSSLSFDIFLNNFDSNNNAIILNPQSSILIVVRMTLDTKERLFFPFILLLIGMFIIDMNNEHVLCTNTKKKKNENCEIGKIQAPSIISLALFPLNILHYFDCTTGCYSSSFFFSSS